MASECSSLEIDLARFLFTHRQERLMFMLFQIWEE